LPFSTGRSARQPESTTIALVPRPAEKIKDDLLGFDLQPGAMEEEEAQLIAEMLNRRIPSISLTILP
jgi:hypothetical protein